MGNTADCQTQPKINQRWIFWEKDIQFDTKNTLPVVINYVTNVRDSNVFLFFFAAFVAQLYFICLDVLGELSCYGHYSSGE